MTMPLAAQTRSYDRAHGVVFYKTREAFGELSNMSSAYPLSVQGISVPSSEALYQACRFPHLPDVQRLIIAQKSPMTAKMVSKPYRSQSREDWDDVRVAVMKWCLRIKLQQHWSNFGGVLLKTGDRPIVEQSRKDPFWGAIPDRSGEVLVGANVLGRLLMELREILRRKATDLNVVKPVPISNFCLLGQPIKAVSRLTLVKSDAPSETRRKAGATMPELPLLVKKDTRPSSPSQLQMFDLPLTRKGGNSRPAKYHVVASRRGGWDVLRKDAKRVSAHCETKHEAVARGRELAAKARVELIIHDRTGRILRCIKYVG